MYDNIQAVLFGKNTWTTKQASNWLKSHGYHPIKKVHETVNYYRYRINEPEKYNKLRIKHLPDDIHLIIGV